MIRYDDMRVDRLLIKEYQRQLDEDIRSVDGLNDIDRVLTLFEGQFARYIGTKHALAVNSGSDALRLALLACGIGRGDSVLVPNLCYPADALSVLYAGAEPILVDSGNDLEVDPVLLEKKCRKDTKAVIAAHMFARPCAIEAIIDFAQRKGLKVIEDCCQAESTLLHGRRLGSFGDCSCFSFSYYKPLSSCGGGGGMVCFNDPAFLKLIKYTQVWEAGEELVRGGQRFPKMSLGDMSAVKAKWKYLKDIIKSRLSIRKVYEEGLSGLTGITFISDPPGAVSVPQNFVILTQKRDLLGAALEKEGVSWQQPYKPLHQVKAFRLFAMGKFPVSDRYAAQAIQLPLFSFMKKEEAQVSVEVIRTFIKKGGLPQQ